MHELWILLAFGGALVIALGLRAARVARVTWGWPSVEAAITVMWPIALEVQGEWAGAYDETTPDPRKLVAFSYEFSYSVDGSTYAHHQQEQLFVGRGTTFENPLSRTAWVLSDQKRATIRVQQFQNRNPIGKRFPVFYEPDDPRTTATAPKHPGDGRAVALVRAMAVVEGVTLALAVVPWLLPVSIAIGSLALAPLVRLFTYYPYRDFLGRVDLYSEARWAVSSLQSKSAS